VQVVLLGPFLQSDDEGVMAIKVQVFQVTLFERLSPERGAKVGGTKAEQDEQKAKQKQSHFPN
jgi:hypothetical protein